MEDFPSRIDRRPLHVFFDHVFSKSISYIVNFNSNLYIHHKIS